jgi:hypothetical protein
MPECDYCGESFADEDAHLDHLAAAHEGELGRIDRRRVADRDGADGDEGFGLGPIILVTLLLFAGVLVVYVTFFMGSGGDGGSGTGTGGAEGAPPREIPDDPLLSDAESFESNGLNHVSQSTDVDYERMPALSGPHYSRAAGPDFYEETPAMGNLVHSIEHGYVVIYYDPGAITPEARTHMENLTSTYTERWESVIAAPNPNADPASPYVLTAWQVRLRMDEYDRDTVDAFLDAFRGRGPENPVR